MSIAHLYQPGIAEIRSKAAKATENAPHLRSRIERAGQIWEVTRGPFLESPLEGPRTLARLSRNLDHVRIMDAPGCSGVNPNGTEVGNLPTVTTDDTNSVLRRYRQNGTSVRT